MLNYNDHVLCLNKGSKMMKMKAYGKIIKDLFWEDSVALKFNKLLIKKSCICIQGASLQKKIAIAHKTHFRAMLKHLYFPLWRS